MRGSLRLAMVRSPGRADRDALPVSDSLGASGHSCETALPFRAVGALGVDDSATAVSTTVPQPRLAGSMILARGSSPVVTGSTRRGRFAELWPLNSGKGLLRSTSVLNTRSLCRSIGNVAHTSTYINARCLRSSIA